MANGNGTDVGLRLKVVGLVHSPFSRSGGTPIQPSVAPDSAGSIEVFAPYKQGLRDLEGFSRVWVLYWCHQARSAEMLVQPFRDTHLRGVFATRAPSRPNPIGLSCVRLLGIESGSVRIAGLDMLDGTPVLDLKPYIPEFDAFPGSEVGWISRVVPGETHYLADGRFERPPWEHAT